MAYKKLTNTGKKFIETVCSGNGNSLLSGSNNYKLIFTDDPKGTIYTASVTGTTGNLITTNKQLGEALIYWFEEYSIAYELDANIIAAQAYIESKYVIWAFPSPSLNSSAQGITQFLSSTLYDVAIGNFGVAGTISTLFTDDEIDRLTLGLIEPRRQRSYVYRNNAANIDIVLANRKPLFQNCMNNPDLLIKAQCKLMKGISNKAANNAASTLFGYNQGPKYVRETYTGTLKNAEPTTLPKAKYDEGVKYVDKIFRVLGDEDSAEHKTKGLWFGYHIDFTFDTFTADVATSGSDLEKISKSTRLSKNYVLGDLIKSDTANKRGITNVPTQREFEKLKIFANSVLEPINTLISDVLIVNSSFRSDPVNASVGGVINSQHRAAEAADVRVNTSDPNLLYSIYETIIGSNILYDQIIYESKGSSIKQRWIHISYKTDEPVKNRKEKLTATLINGNMKYDTYTP